MIQTFFRNDHAWDPFREWGTYFANPARRSPANQPATVAPRYEVEENDDGFLLSLDIPGVRKEDITLETKGKTLTVSAKRKVTKNGEASEVAYHANFEVPELVTFDGVEASYQDGVLNVALPKVKEATSRTIKVGDGKGDFLGKLVQGFKRDDAKKEASV